MSAPATTTETPAAAAFTPLQTTKWELGVSLILHSWPALTDAVNSGWGGPDSSDKRDWLCGAIADMFVANADTDEYDVEDTLTNVMEDEFEVNLEDDSAYDIGKRVTILRTKIAENDFAEVDAMHAKFLEKAAKGGPVLKPVVQEVEEEAGSSEDEEEEGADTQMGETPAPREKVEAVVDEDGFELVQKKGKGKR